MLIRIRNLDNLLNFDINSFAKTICVHGKMFYICNNSQLSFLGEVDLMSFFSIDAWRFFL